MAADPAIAGNTPRHRQERHRQERLALPEPRRLRDRDHLKYVAQQACLVCGRAPCDPHHLRFTQSPALGRRSATSSRSRCAGAIIASSTATAMKRRGGASAKSIRRSQPGPYGWKLIHGRRLRTTCPAKALPPLPSLFRSSLILRTDQCLRDQRRSSGGSAQQVPLAEMNIS